MIKKSWFFIIIFLSITCLLVADPPEWISTIPYEKDAFLGVGSGLSLDEATENARIDILMQLSSKVNSSITISEGMSPQDGELVELCKTVITTNSLRGAEVADSYESPDAVYVLLRYCDSCGSILVESALLSAASVVSARRTDEAATGLDLERVLEEVNSSASSDAVKLKRELQGPAVPLIELPEPEEEAVSTGTIESDQYNTDNIIVSVADDSVLIRLINFLPNQDELTEQQINELQSLSTTLFIQLQKMGYSGVSIIGHANPEGKENEEEELIKLSLQRARTMEQYLASSGVIINSVDCRGGNELLGSVETEEGRGRNRRVDIYVHF